VETTFVQVAEASRIARTYDEGGRGLLLVARLGER
jgi:hypothetical protein